MNTKRLVIIAALALPFAAQAQLAELEYPGSVSAVQEREYRMGHELNLSIGSIPLDAFYKGFYGELSYTYHFTDFFAWRVGRGAYSYNISTGLDSQLEHDFGVKPTALEQAQYWIGSDVIFTPFFGKTAVVNKSVLFFETNFIVGLSIFKFTVSNFAPAANLGAGVRLFQNHYVSWRLDFTDNIVIFTTKKPLNVPTITLTLALNFGANP
ncbi:MAG: outer membrane beta-barrel domain-containing protein [Myxococcaceae bacterium]